MVQDIARFSHVPVWNGLTDEAHPAQVLADLMTMAEFGGNPLHELSFCYPIKAVAGADVLYTDAVLM